MQVNDNCMEHACHMHSISSRESISHKHIHVDSLVKTDLEAFTCNTQLANQLTQGYRMPSVALPALIKLSSIYSKHKQFLCIGAPSV